MNENADIEATLCGSALAPTPTSAICYWLRLRGRVAASSDARSEAHGTERIRQAKLPIKSQPNFSAPKVKSKSKKWAMGQKIDGIS